MNQLVWCTMRLSTLPSTRSRIVLKNGGIKAHLSRQWLPRSIKYRVRWYNFREAPRAQRSHEWQRILRPRISTVCSLRRCKNSRKPNLQIEQWKIWSSSMRTWARSSSDSKRLHPKSEISTMPWLFKTSRLSQRSTSSHGCSVKWATNRTLKTGAKMMVAPVVRRLLLPKTSETLYLGVKDCESVTIAASNISSITISRQLEFNTIFKGSDSFFFNM